MKLRAIITHYVDDNRRRRRWSPPGTVYEVWVYDMTDPDRPRKLTERVGKYTTLYRAERAKRRFDGYRVKIELEDARLKTPLDTMRAS